MMLSLLEIVQLHCASAGSSLVVDMGYTDSVEKPL
jgi:hypothetical protein